VAALLPLLLCAEVWAQVTPEPVDWDDALDQETVWYGGAEAICIADNVLLYQHASGGWPKNIDMAEVLSVADKNRIRDEQAKGGTTLSNITIDNGATYTPMRYLARVYEATGRDRFAEGFFEAWTICWRRSTIPSPWSQWEHARTSPHPSAAARAWASWST